MSMVRKPSVTSGAPAPELLDEPPAREYESRYHEILASRLAQLPLPACADEEGPNLPSDETVEALVRSSFYDDELRAALVEYQAHKLLSRPDDVHGRDGDSGEVDSPSSLMDDITEEEFSRDLEVLSSRRHEIDHTEAELEEEEADRLSHKGAMSMKPLLLRVTAPHPSPAIASSRGSSRKRTASAKAASEADQEATVSKCSRKSTASGKKKSAPKAAAGKKPQNW
ncbi:hypothetical protein TRIUR3_24124 [Triticum urartu]|uniref:Uncharacterized protein n=1 Tax=Triticum urartu TaxID=4572 RepID=M7Z4H2_TRIUA|nr:hypothetical protein TRIUR3_24124 [Triticum urartu]